jgi:hypothetical protein
VLSIDPVAELDPRLAGRPKREQTEVKGASGFGADREREEDFLFESAVTY